MYTVGSLADLISGNDTPNKQSVQIKEVKYEKPIVANIIKKEKDGKEKSKKEKKKNKQNTETPMETTENINEKQMSKKKKKKNKQNTETSMETTENLSEKQLNKKEKKKNKQNTETSMETTENLSEKQLIKKEKKKNKQNTETSMETTENISEKQMSKKEKKKNKQNIETPMETTENISEKQKSKKKKKKNKENTETPMEATENIIPKQMSENKNKKNTDTPMESTENIIQNQNLNNAQKRKILKRKAIESDTPQNVSNKKKKIDKEKTEDFEKHDDRTIFIGNVPLSTNKKDFKKFFSSYGEVETLRFRCIPPADMKTPQKVAFMKKQFHPKRKTMIAYVCYKSPDSACRAAKADGQKFNNFHLRVEYLNEKIKYDNKKTIFLGNVPFDAEEEDVRKAFEDCGKVIRVRLVRDKRTNMGKGFGYVNFENSDAVDLALQLGNVEMGKREVRIMRCTKEDQNKNKTADGRKARERFAIYIFDLPENTTERDLRELFGKCGNILSTRIVHSDQTHCFVNFEDSEGVRNAVNMQNPVLHGVPLNVKAKMQKNNEQKPAIYIRNLPLKTTKDEIHDIFKDCGAISFIRLFLKKTRPTGVGFVNFENDDAIEKALEKKVKIGNSELMITRKTDKPDLKDVPDQLENLVEEHDEETELMTDLTKEKKWDDDVSSSDDEESDTNESPSVVSKETKLSEDVESGVETEDEDDEKELDKILMEVKEDSDDSDDDDDDDEDDVKKRPIKKVAPIKNNLQQVTPIKNNLKQATPKEMNGKPITPKNET